MQEEYYHTKKSVQEYIKAADGYNGNNLINKLITLLPKGSSLLELGSGPGTDWKLLKQAYDVTGSDYSPEFLSYLKSENPTGTFLRIDARAIKVNEKFEGLFSNKVLHHLNDKQLDQSIYSQAKTLNKNGIICHSFWKGNGTEDFKGMFVNYQSKQSLRDLFTPLFDILLLEEYQEFEEGDSLLMISRKK